MNHRMERLAEIFQEAAEAERFEEAAWHELLWLIKEEDRSVFKKGARQSQALGLASTQFQSALACHCFIAHR